MWGRSVKKQFVNKVFLILILTGVFWSGIALGYENDVSGNAGIDEKRGQRIPLDLTFRDENGALVNTMQIDPAGGTAWVAKLMREANINLVFKSPVNAGGSGLPYVGVPYSFTIKANGQSDDTANIVWTARPLNFRPGRQITVAVTGTFVANTGSNI
jgi:hypothetical protein